LFAATFFMSGGCALIYQVLWSKHLQYVFGSTTEAVGTILAVFMAGLGAGAYLFGPRIDRSPAPLRLYALLEIGIGLYGLIGLFLLRAATSVFARFGELPGPASTLLKLTLAAIVLLPPCLLMGATFPALLRGVSRSLDGARRNVGLFYAVNLIGALVGALAAGIALIPAYGLTRSSFVAAAVNFAIGATVWFAAGRVETSPATQQPGEEGATASDRGFELRYLQLGLFVSGASIMTFEIVVTRVLALIFGVSAYAFTVVLAVFLLGLGLGAWIYERWTTRTKVGTLQFATVQLVLAAIGAWFIVVLPGVPRWVLYLRQIPGLGFWELLAGKALLATILILPLATVAGLGLPILIGALVSDVGKIGRTVGRAYLVNTAGTIAGSLVTGFVLIAWLGTEGTLRATLFVSLLVGLAGIVLLGRSRGSRLLAVAASGLIVLALLLPDPWPVRLFINSDTDGSHTVATTPLEVEDQLRSTPNRVLFFEEGRNATVAVTETPTVRSLLVNAHPDGSDSAADMATQVMLGAIPLTMHPAPRDVLVIGFGTGVSTRSATRLAEVERVDAIEIEPAVMAASPFFHHINGAVEQDPRVRIHLTDARTFAATTRQRYDVIVSEPSNPWRAGVANLYSTNFFRSARGLLRDDGIFAQWMHLYFVRDAELRLVLRTMLDVFPEIQVWWLDAGNIVILTSEKPLTLQPQRVRDLLDGEFREDRIRFAKTSTVEEFYGRILLDTQGVRDFVGTGGDTHSDDRPFLEYRAPRGLLEADGRNTLRLVAAKLRNGTLTAPGAETPGLEAHGWLAVAAMFDSLQMHEEQVEAVRRALATGDPLAKIRGTELALLTGDIPSAQGFLQALIASGERPEHIVRDLAYAHAHLAMAIGDVQAVRAALELTGDWDGRAGLEWLAFAVAGGQLDVALDAAERLLGQARLGGAVGNPEVERIFALLYELTDDDESAGLVLALAQRLPSDENLSPLARLKVLALLYERLGRFEEAIETSLRVERYGVLDFELLALRLRGLRRLGRTQAAERLEQRLRKLDPRFDADPISIPLG